QRIVEAEELAHESLAAAQSAGPEAEHRALHALAWARVMRGHAIDDVVESFSRLGPATSTMYRGSLERLIALRRAFRGDPAEAREVFRLLSETADERGDFRSRMVLAIQICEVEVRAGRSFEASRALEEADEWNESGIAGGQAILARVHAALAALRG